MTQFTETMREAQNQFDVLGVPALLLSFDHASQQFEIWEYLTPPAMSDFFLNEWRMPLCKVTPKSRISELSDDQLDAIGAKWLIVATKLTWPPLTTDLLTPSA